MFAASVAAMVVRRTSEASDLGQVISRDDSHTVADCDENLEAYIQAGRSARFYLARVASRWEYPSASPGRGSGGWRVLKTFANVESLYADATH